MKASRKSLVGLLVVVVLLLSGAVQRAAGEEPRPLLQPMPEPQPIPSPAPTPVPQPTTIPLPDPCNFTICPPSGLKGKEEGPLTEYEQQPWVSFWALEILLENLDDDPQFLDHPKKVLDAISDKIKEVTRSDPDDDPPNPCRDSPSCPQNKCDRLFFSAEELLSPDLRCRSGCTQFGLMFVAIARKLGVKVLYVGTTKEDIVQRVRNGETVTGSWGGHFFVIFRKPGEMCTVPVGNDSIDVNCQWLLYNPNGQDEKLVGNLGCLKDDSDCIQNGISNGLTNGYTVEKFNGEYDRATGKGIAIYHPGADATFISHVIGVDPAELGIVDAAASRQAVMDAWAPSP